jgi:polysaccharide biosynthesis PFTS motif protein
MRGRWWIPLLLGEVIKSKVVDLMPMSRRSDRYLFHYSGSVYRPLWTYRFEQSSTEIICYFYSTYDQPSIGKESTDFSEVEFSLLNWPKFLVWDAFQKQKIENAIGDRYLVSIVGPVLFSDSFELSPDVVNDYVAVFNIDPHRISSFFGISTLADYYFNCPEVQIRFLLDLEKVCSELDIDIVIKYKRDIGERAVKSYLAHQGRLSGDKHVHFADPNISPLRIIEKSMAVVSAPFTSTALYGVRKRVPSVFYDPSGWIDPKDPSARDIKVISGIDSLRRWLIGVVALGRQ